MKLTLFIIALIFVAPFCFAQQKIIKVSYIKNGMYVENKDSADYFRFVSEPDSGSVLFNVVEYYKNGKRKLIGKSSVINYPVFEGQCATFYDSGIRQSAANYKKGFKVGDEFDFYPSGKPYRVKEYPDNGDRYNDLNNNYLIEACYDSTGTALVQDGNGYYKGYDAGFKYIYEEGSVKNGKRNSLWKGEDKNLKLTFTENYKDGSLISGVAIDSTGKSTTYTKTRGVPPQFKGGLAAFSRYLASGIVYPTIARENGEQGIVFISFVVEKDGGVDDVKITRSVSGSIDAEALRVIRNTPRWNPGTQFGRNVRVVYTVPVSFTLQGN